MQNDLICASESRLPARRDHEETALTTTQLLIGGQWTAARSGEIEQVRSPFALEAGALRTPLT